MVQHGNLEPEPRALSISLWTDLEALYWKRVKEQVDALRKLRKGEVRAVGSAGTSPLPSQLLLKKVERC